MASTAGEPGTPKKDVAESVPAARPEETKAATMEDVDDAPDPDEDDLDDLDGKFLAAHVPENCRD
jgi:peroxin-19